ncbi:NAD-dependent epimerase/dehydratase family protein [Paenibacillus sp. 1P03SA]|uniref:NAD-dependent epimerase/dehydratase family protein n=1 Tax=Paenibacillus sp. 1P03SA TaxID=3132294 RepID=UPI0039A32AC9
MQNVLILGGTRFFGKKLTANLLRSGTDVTILTRGNASDSFGPAVKRLHADRTDAAALRQAVGSVDYDVVYDNICYTPQDAEAAVRLFDGRAGRYIVTSSKSVYPYGGPRKTENDFDPYGYPLPSEYPDKPDYAEGKRLVEAVLFRNAAFPAAAVRFPIVLGPDDYTRRLHFHIGHIKQGLPLGIPNPDALLTFIDSDEAASFLGWLGTSKLEGPVNACSKGETTPGKIVSLIEEALNKQAHVTDKTDEDHMSPFGVPESWYMDTSKAEAAGYTFRRLDDWLPDLIRNLAGED